MVLAVLKQKAGGDVILTEYKDKTSLSSETRRLLVNILVGHMVEMHGRIPTKNKKEQYALGIVTLFPSFKDPFSKKGYVNQDFKLLFDAETASKLLERWDTTFKQKIISEAMSLTSTPAVCSLLRSAKNETDSQDSKRALKISAVDAASRILVHHKSCNSIEEHLRQRKGRQPYLLAVGGSPRQIDQYYIALDQKLIPCQAGGSLSAFDELFKIHFCFNLMYDDALLHFFTFMQTTVYKIDIGKTKESPRVKELRAKLIN
ncbi:uncharacterized protein [Osmerus mordax]|uniref:uncharacterized protein n=1 Tax=Osmerus mordax TaxID=8014 RepID=UPI0035109D0F